MTNATSGMFPETLNRRGFLRAGALAGAATVAGCAPAVSGPGDASSPPPAAGKAPWEQEWDRLVAAAKQEGKLAPVTLVGVGQRRILEEFQKAFPGIEVDQQSFSSASLIAPRVIQERDAGIYSFDVALLSTGTALRELKPKGVWEPIRSLLFRPDVTDDKAWTGGFDDGFSDSERRWTYVPSLNAQRPWAIDTGQVNEAELRTVKDLLDPKWKGKIISADVRAGSAWTYAAIREYVGEAVLKPLLVDQQVAFTRDSRQLVEAVIRGRYAIGQGATRQVIREFWEQGVGKHVKLIDLEGSSWALADAIFVFNRSPHPNAARLFVNWALSKEGQQRWSEAFDVNSRRIDVPAVYPDESPIPGRKYLRSDLEANFDKIVETRDILYPMLDIKN